MTYVHLEIAGKSVDVEVLDYKKVPFEVSWFGAMVVGFHKKLGDMRCPVHGKRATIHMVGPRIDDLEMKVTGLGGKIPASKAELFVGNAGTAARFLTAFLTLGSGEYILDGEPRMRERPIGDLVEALKHLGANISPLLQRQPPSGMIRARMMKNTNLLYVS